MSPEERIRIALDPDVEPWNPRCCSGPCWQGRRLCPTPQACSQPDYSRNDRIATRFIAAVLLTVACLAVSSVLAYLFGGRA